MKTLDDVTATLDQGIRQMVHELRKTITSETKLDVIVDLIKVHHALGGLSMMIRATESLKEDPKMRGYAVIKQLETIEDVQRHLFIASCMSLMTDELMDQLEKEGKVEEHTNKIANMLKEAIGSVDSTIDHLFDTVMGSKELRSQLQARRKEGQL
jgi:predicted dinucleotide-utilizing enzyme